MGLKDIERSLVGYYGEHQSKHVQATALKYIESTYTEEAYKTLLQEIMKTHPFNYGFPDVSAIEKASDYYYQRNDKKSLKKARSGSAEWTTQYIPLTDEQREASSEAHEQFLEMSKKIAAKKTVKDENKYCKDCSHFSKDKTNINCMGCIDHKKFDDKTQK